MTVFTCGAGAGVSAPARLGTRFVCWQAAQRTNWAPLAYVKGCRQPPQVRVAHCLVSYGVKCG